MESDDNRHVRVLVSDPGQDAQALVGVTCVIHMRHTVLGELAPQLVAQDDHCLYHQELEERGEFEIKGFGKVEAYFRMAELPRRR
jgi:hypothetical protein